MDTATRTLPSIVLVPEVGTLRDLELVDLPTGHWPMWSRPTDLAAAIANAAAH
jgi:hypothetical protein